VLAVSIIRVMSKPHARKTAIFILAAVGTSNLTQQSVKDDLGLKTLGVYSMPCECGQVYIGHTGCFIETRIKEYQCHICLEHPDK
jgi:hypothetical protein